MKALVDVQPVTPAGGAEETVTRKLKAGAVHFANGKRLVAGDEVELTKTQEVAFADKLEPVETPKFRQAEGEGIEKDYKPTEEDLKAQATPPLPTSHSPQDIGAKTATPGMVDSNPGNLTRAPRPAVPVNPTQTDVAGHPPINDPRLAVIAGGNRAPAEVLAEAGSVPATAAAPGSAPSGPAAPAKAPAGTPVAPAKTPAAPSGPAAPASSGTKTPEDLTSRGDKKK